jgi:hypothetical protein
VAKEALGMPRSRFLLGDALTFLRDNETTFDVGVACAFLNHMTDPVEVIALLARRCRRLFVWNVVYDESIFTKQPELKTRFGPPETHETGGFRHTLFPHFYGEGFDYRTFLGGAKPACCWMQSAEIVAALKHFGFTAVRHHEEENPFGKAISAVATKG